MSWGMQIFDRHGQNKLDTKDRLTKIVAIIQVPSNPGGTRVFYPIQGVTPTNHFCFTSGNPAIHGTDVVEGGVEYLGYRVINENNNGAIVLLGGVTITVVEY